MEDAEEVIQGETEGCTPELLDSKRYELKYKEYIYFLLIERSSDDYIHFQLRKSNNISMYHYINKYKYNDITNIFHYQMNIKKIHLKYFNFLI